MAGRAISDAKIRAWLNQLPKPLEKPRKLAIGDGLYLLARPPSKRRAALGAAYGAFWRFRYTRLKDGAVRENTIDVGRYPDVGLAEAKARRDEARRMLAESPPRDPAIHADWTRAARRAAAQASADTFRAVAAEWFGKQQLAETTRTRNGRLLGYLYTYLGDRPLREIQAAEMLDALRKIEAEHGAEAASRARQLAANVFAYAIPDGRAAGDPTAGLDRALPPQRSKRRPAITDPRALGELLRAIDGYHGQPVTRAALQLLALTFVRPGELRLAQWQEFDAEGAQWVIPRERMKMRNTPESTAHIVPLARQALAILEALRPITYRGPGSYVFPAMRPRRPLSENTANGALRALGYDTAAQHCAHGFRATAATLLAERGFDPDLIECQLAHKRPGVGGIYNRAHRLAERRRMMQSWADYLDALRASGKGQGAAVTCLCREFDGVRYLHPACPAHGAGT